MGDMQDNPYHPPQVAERCDTRAAGDSVTLTKAVLFVLGMAAGGAFLGLALGAFLGAFVPEYYRSVFSRGDSPEFNPLAVGIGLGLTQGAGFGAVVGSVLIAAFYWYKVKTSAARQN